MRISCAVVPDYPVDDYLETIELADALGFYGFYAADEIWHKDPYVLFGAAARRTRNIRFGPSVAPIALREPTQLCQAIATLDELSSGRTECVISIGNFAMLSQYGLEWSRIRPLSRVKEAHQVMRTLLDTGAVDRDGEFFQYHGLFTLARPVQKHVPVLIGAMKGPKSFEAAGEWFDGTHSACNYSRKAVEYMAEHVKIGATRAGRDWRQLDIAAWFWTVVGPDSKQAKAAAQAVSGIFIPSMSAEQLQRNGITPAEVQPFMEAFRANRVEEALRLVTPETAEKLALAGTADEVTNRLQSLVEGTAVNHLVLSPCDAHVVKAYTGRDFDIPDVKQQLRLLHDDVMPVFAGDGLVAAMPSR